MVRQLVALPGGLIASASHDETVRVWDPTNGELITTFHTGAITALAALPNGDLISGVYQAFKRDFIPGAAYELFGGFTLNCTIRVWE
jgi:WD40 repeat protein